ncbi:MAG: hypothetical protein M3O15_07385, partial [Acidobacteriota bacterium]|nr:hypothetical protein [Acidobacteriota bacterium]
FAQNGPKTPPSAAAGAAAAGEEGGRLRDLILMSSTAFWDAYLKGDLAAKAWLARGDLATALGSDGKVETKVR